MEEQPIVKTGQFLGLSIVTGHLLNTLHCQSPTCTASPLPYRTRWLFSLNPLPRLSKSRIRFRSSPRTVSSWLVRGDSVSSLLRLSHSLAVTCAWSHVMLVNRIY